MIDLAAFLIGFREALEACLVVGIVLAFLSRTGKKEFSKLVWLGVLSAVVASIVLAFLFNAFIGEFEGIAEQLFEGSLMVFAAILVSWMILWALKQRNSFKAELEKSIQKHAFAKDSFEIFLLSFVAVLREGVETVIFLNAAVFKGGEASTVFGALGGIALAIIVGYILFSGMKKINLKLMFSITGILLVLFAAGLVSNAVHEFQEAKLIPFDQPLWDINPPINADGSYPLLHENGLIGQTANHLLGYKANPSMPEILAYIAYLGAIFLIYKKISKPDFTTH